RRWAFRAAASSRFALAFSSVIRAVAVGMFASEIKRPSARLVAGSWATGATRAALFGCGLCQRANVWVLPHRLQTSRRTLPAFRSPSARRRPQLAQRRTSNGGAGAGTVGMTIMIPPAYRTGRRLSIEHPQPEAPQVARSGLEA